MGAHSAPSGVGFDAWVRPAIATDVRGGETCDNRWMDALTAFGLFAVTAMLVCYALDERSPWWTFGFAWSCLLGSAYGFMQGAWPFGLVEGVWSVVAAQRWWTRRASSHERA